MKKSVIWAAWLSACGMLSGCSDSQPMAMQAAPVEVGYVTLSASRFPIMTELQGRTVASLSAQVRPQVSGIVDERLFTEGSQVNKGDILYRINSRVYQAAFNEAQANLNSAQASLRSAQLKDQRYANLLDIEGISRQDADDAHAAYLEAKANIEKYQASLESARINLQFTTLSAPISGRISISSITPGALVTADQSTALATIITLDPIYVDMTQSSRDLLKLRQLLQRNNVRQGDTDVSLTLEDGSVYPLKGHLKMREVSVDEATGNVILRAEFANPDGVLLPGMFVRAQLSQAVNENAILVPQQGIYHTNRGDAYAYVIKDDNTIEKREVRADRAVSNQWLITSGLQANEKLLVEGSAKVAPGAKVNPVAVTLASASNGGK